MGYDFATHQALQKRAGQRNLRAALRQLRALGATAFVVEYDGSGDDGQIGFNGIEGTDPELEQRAARVRVPVWYVKSDATDEPSGPRYRHRLARKTTSLNDLATDALCDHLDALWSGYENNDGAFGRVRLDVATGTLTVEHNARYIAHDTSTSTVEVLPPRPASTPALAPA